ncbi:MAG: hypothetical protein LBF22_02340 [Deltaproteobacteria bacterium]|jgi:hypothetical protein|nr:hypothetical protein [Deltaproteobacteria bacterium]
MLNKFCISLFRLTFVLLLMASISFVGFLPTKVKAENSTPNLEWQKTFGGTKRDIANSMQNTSDGGSIVVGKKFFQKLRCDRTVCEWGRLDREVRSFGEYLMAKKLWRNKF